MKLTTDRQDSSRGLSATAELLVANVSDRHCFSRVCAYQPRSITGQRRLKAAHSIILASPAANLVENVVASGSKACQKPAPNLLKTELTSGLKRVFFSTFHSSSTHMNQRTCCGSPPGLRQKSRTLVESVSQTRTNLSKTWLQTWSKTRFAAG